MLCSKPLLDLSSEWFAVLRIWHSKKLSRGYNPKNPAFAGAAWLNKVSHVAVVSLFVVHSGQQSFGYRDNNPVKTSTWGGWRRRRDSNPRDDSSPTPLAGERLRPLGHVSAGRSNGRSLGKQDQISSFLVGLSCCRSGIAQQQPIMNLFAFKILACHLEAAQHRPSKVDHDLLLKQPVGHVQRTVMAARFFCSIKA